MLNFYYFDQILINNYKSVTYPFCILKKHDKNMILSFLENIHKRLLGFDHMHKDKNIFFCVFEMRNYFEFVFEILEKNQVFLIPDPYLIVYKSTVQY